MKLEADLRPMWMTPLLAVAAAFLGGCSTIDETASSVFSSNTHATAVFAGRVLFGTANFTRAREATVELQSDEGPSLSCLGNLRYTSTTAGVVGFSCSDGQMVTIPFQSLSALRGSGRTQNANGVFALTYGLQPPMAAPYLGLSTDRSMPPEARAAAAAAAAHAKTAQAAPVAE